MATEVVSSPFSQAVFAAMRRLYPEDLADKSFDNTGLLLEAPLNLGSELENSVLLAIDLTSSVAQEAIDKKTSVVVAYHPIIFKGLKQLNFSNSQQTSLLRLAAQGISVYCPHTAVDAATGGNADWMADVITSKFRVESPESPVISTHMKDSEHGFGPYGLFKFPEISKTNLDSLSLNSYAHSRHVIQPSPVHEGAGGGRIVRFNEPRPLEDILWVIAHYFGYPRAFSVACAHGKKVSELSISAAGVCAGSGGSILGPVDDIDLLVTGELSHHEVLAAVENGKSVIAFNHSNSERGYLEAVMKSKLEEVLTEEWAKRRELYVPLRDHPSSTAANEQLFATKEVDVVVSQMDRDPYEIAVLGSPP